MATIKDIAKLSGYSIGTVSRVINEKPDVSPEAREKILQIIKDEGFQPNSHAQRLKQQTPSEIAVIVSGYGNLLFVEILEQIQETLIKRGQIASVYYQDENSNSVEAAEKIMLERNPKGFIFLGGVLDHFRKGFSVITAPSVLVTNNASDLEFDNLSSFSTDDLNASRDAVKYLIDHGHKKIGIIGGFMINASIIDWRLKGGMDEMKERGIRFNAKKQYVESRFSMEGGYAAAQTLLERCPDVTAIFALGDVIALGAMRAIRDLKLRIPEDISIIGFDGIKEGQYYCPRLMTIRQDTGELAKKAVETLLLNISYPHPATHEMVQHQIIRGESVADRDKGER